MDIPVNIESYGVCRPLKKHIILRRFPDLIDWDFGESLEYNNIEELMMESFLRDMGEDIKKEWEGNMDAVDITDELKDLLKVYSDAEESLKRKEEHDLSGLQFQMKKYMATVEDRQKVAIKLKNLQKKMEKPFREEE